jgi:hypothetical protein
MRQHVPHTDARQAGWCYSCGRAVDSETRTVEHIPARIFLDRPFPDNLATVASCFECNNGTSADELYVACLLDAALVGTTDRGLLVRERVRQAIAGSPQLNERLTVALAQPDSGLGPSAESVEVVVTKLARGHAEYDLADPRHGPPESIRWFRLDEASTSDVESFERWTDRSSPVSQLLPEVGSRALSGLFDSEDEGSPRPWTTVQGNRYRYSCRVDCGSAIRLVLRGYLACEVTWS